MISKAVYKKLKQTKLFSDAQKTELFALLPDASEEDIRKLEAGIDAFDSRFQDAVQAGSSRIQDILAEAASGMTDEEWEDNQEAVDQVALGFALLTS